MLTFKEVQRIKKLETLEKIQLYTKQCKYNLELLDSDNTAQNRDMFHTYIKLLNNSTNMYKREFL